MTGGERGHGEEQARGRGPHDVGRTLAESPGGREHGSRGTWSHRFNTQTPVDAPGSTSHISVGAQGLGSSEPVHRWRQRLMEQTMPSGQGAPCAAQGSEHCIHASGFSREPPMDTSHT